jgi:cell division septation protein DedD
VPRRHVRPLVFAVLAAACTDAPATVVDARPAGAWTGPDAVLVRLPEAGGSVRAYRWGRDSVIWTSAQPAPRSRALIGFDADEGTVTVADPRGVPSRVELRLGSVTPSATTPMENLTTADGWAVYGVNPKRELERLTPSGNWAYRSALTPRLIVPVPDGSLVLVSDIGERSTLRRLHPPEARVSDTASVPSARFAVTTAIGDRIYFGTDSGLAGVRVRDLSRTRTIALPGPAADAAPTPSGDRVFVALVADPVISVIDRYDERVTGSIRLTAPAVALRMDPDGRYLLAQRDGQDSVDVISVAESRVAAVIASRWRGDLPLVGPDGAVLVLQGDDAVDIDPATLKVRRRYDGGAGDLWALIRWNGFRPRAKGLDVPVTFDGDSADTAAVVSESPPPSTSAPAPRVAPAEAARVPARGGDEPEPRERSNGWTLSFAALLDEQRARSLAATIRVEGKPVRVISGLRDGATIWRIVYGPFATREEAERAGRRTGLPYWVYEETP